MQGTVQSSKSVSVVHHINKMMDKDCMIISTYAEKAFDKIQHSFMIKITNKSGIERTYLNTTKAVYALLLYMFT